MGLNRDRQNRNCQGRIHQNLRLELELGYRVNLVLGTGNLGPGMLSLGLGLGLAIGCSVVPVLSGSRPLTDRPNNKGCLNVTNYIKATLQLRSE